MKNREIKNFLQKLDDKNMAAHCGFIASWIALFIVNISLIFAFIAHPVVSLEVDTISPEAWKAFQDIGGTDVLHPLGLFANTLILIVLMTWAFKKRESLSGSYCLMSICIFQMKDIEEVIWALFPSGNLSPIVANFADNNIAVQRLISNVVLMARSYSVSPASFVSKAIIIGIFIAYMIGGITTWAMQKFYDYQRAANI